MGKKSGDAPARGKYKGGEAFLLMTRAYTKDMTEGIINRW